MKTSITAAVGYLCHLPSELTKATKTKAVKNEAILSQRQKKSDGFSVNGGVMAGDGTYAQRSKEYGRLYSIASVSKPRCVSWYLRRYLSL